MAVPLPGDRVQLQGLSRQDLNGVVGVILEPEDETEALKLQETGRLKVSYYPKPLSLKPENVVAAPPPDFATPPLPFTALQVVRQDETVTGILECAREEGEGMGRVERIAGINNPLEFAEAFWILYFNDLPPALGMPADLERVILDTPGHQVYWLGLEQISHHIVIEACDGVWRGYQCSTKLDAVESGAFQSFGDVLVQPAGLCEACGYSAKEWVSPMAIGTVDTAYELWGGGKDLTRRDVAKILQLVCSLREQAGNIAKRLRAQVSEISDEDLLEWVPRMIESARLSMTPSRPGTPRSGVAEANEVYVFISDVTPEYDLSLPNHVAHPFMNTYARLTGEYPSAKVLLGILGMVDYEKMEMSDGGRVGWTIRSNDLRRR